jgi:excisionase family DNA binding protein
MTLVNCESLWKLPGRRPGTGEVVSTGEQRLLIAHKLPGTDMQQGGGGIRRIDSALHASASHRDSWQPVFLTVTEAARTMSQSRPSVLRQIHSGQLRSLRLGRTYRIPDQHANRILADGSCDDMYLTAAECARILRCPHRTIGALVHHGHLAGRLNESHDCCQVRIAEFRCFLNRFMR